MLSSFLSPHTPLGRVRLSHFTRVSARVRLLRYSENVTIMKKKKTKKTTVLQSSSVLYSECIGPQLNFQVEKKSKLLYTGSCLFNEIYFIKLTALQALDIGFIFT